MPINNFLLPGAKVTTGYDVDNSIKLAGDAYLSKTPSNATYLHATFSFWIKRSKITSTQGLFGRKGSNATAHGTFCHFTAADELLINFRDSGGTSQYYIITNRKFRDVASWMHIHIMVDGNNGTQADRMQLWINGTRETSFALGNFPSASDYEISTFNDDGGTDFTVGRSLRSQVDTFYNFEGYMAEFHCSVTEAYAPTVFGEFDEDSPTIWKPKKVTGVSYGNDGFYLEFKQTGTSQNSSGIGADTSGEDHHYAVTNLAATDQATDTCTNNFATLNPLDNVQSDATYSEGNLKWATSTNSHYFWGRSTIGVSASKWYMEFKATSIPEHGYFGICVDGPDDNTTFLTNGGRNDHVEYGYKTSDGNSYNNTGDSSYGDTYDDGDIIGVALDLTNNKLYFSKNGTWQNSGDPTSGATGTGAISITAAASNGFGEYFFCCADGTSGTSGTFEANFGNPTFSISSGNSDANGYGNFEYAVPSGYLALCTKNLGSDGG